MDTSLLASVGNAATLHERSTVLCQASRARIRLIQKTLAESHEARARALRERMITVAARRESVMAVPRGNQAFVYLHTTRIHARAA
jgi:hypothetical protein